MKTKNSKIFGASVLLLSGIVCKALGALFRLPLTNMLGIEGIGIFQLTMSLYSFALIITCGGITNSMSKLISTARARSEHLKINTYLKRALLTSIFIGLLIGTIFFIFGRYISNLQGIGSNNSYFLFVIILPLGAGLASLRGFFQGYENMLPTAISQILEQVFKFALGLLFAFYFGRASTAAGVYGAFLGITLSEFIAIIFLFVLYLSKNKKHESLESIREIKFAQREFDKANFSLALSASILPLVNALDSLFVIPRLTTAGFSSGFATKLFGLQSGVVGALLNFPLIISMAVTTTLLPNISYLISRSAGSKHVIERGMKTLLYLILPTTFGLVAISNQALSLVYSDMNGQILQTAFQLMFYGAFSIIFTAIMQYLTMILQAHGEYKYIVAITTIGGTLKTIISFVFSAIPSINIFALVLGNIILSATICILALCRIKKFISFIISFKQLFMLILGTTAMFIMVYAFINCNYFNIYLNLLVGVFLGIIVYFVVTIPFLMTILPNKKLKKISLKA